MRRGRRGKHVVGVGAIQPGDTRTFSLQVEARGAGGFRSRGGRGAFWLRGADKTSVAFARVRTAANPSRMPLRGGQAGQNSDLGSIVVLHCVLSEPFR